MDINCLPTWEILVPHRMGEHDKLEYPKPGKVIKIKYHQEWDEKVREIAGGMTLLRAAKGLWTDPETSELYNEIMIPVRITCTEEEIIQIAKFTKEYYQQKAIWVMQVSLKTIIL